MVDCLGARREGHRLLRYPLPARNDLPTAYACHLCHRTGAHKQVLAGTCDEAPTRSRTGAYRKLEQGMHPHPRRGREAVYSAAAEVPCLDPVTPPAGPDPGRRGRPRGGRALRASGRGLWRAARPAGERRHVAVVKIIFARVHDARSVDAESLSPSPYSNDVLREVTACVESD